MSDCDYGAEASIRPPDYVQDPDSTLDYEFDWSADLADDTIATSTFLLPDGGTQSSASNTDTTATIWLTTVPEGRVIRVTNRITTAGGRTLDKTRRILGKEQ